MNHSTFHQVYLKTYGEDEFTNSQDIVHKEPIPFYLKTKEFKNGVLSKRKSITEIWFNYDLANNGQVDLKVITDSGKIYEKVNVLPNGKNQTQCIKLPNEIQNVYSYTFEISGQGDFTIYGMERVDRTNPR